MRINVVLKQKKGKSLGKIMEDSTIPALREQVSILQQQLQDTNEKLLAIHAALEQHQVNSRPVTSLPQTPEQKVEYKDLVHRYGHHLNKGVDGLLALWRQLGGEHGWCNYCLTPDQLTLLLSQDETPVIHLRVNRQLNRATHGTYIEEADVRPFFCQVLSRLPNLKRIMLTDSPVSPFDWQSMSNIPNPFPQLRFLMLWSTPSSPADLIELAKRVPTLTPVAEDPNGGVRVNRDFLVGRNSHCGVLSIEPNNGLDLNQNNAQNFNCLSGGICDQLRLTSLIYLFYYYYLFPSASKITNESDLVGDIAPNIFPAMDAKTMNTLMQRWLQYSPAERQAFINNPLTTAEARQNIHEVEKYCLKHWYRIYCEGTRLAPGKDIEERVAEEEANQASNNSCGDTGTELPSKVKVLLPPLFAPFAEDPMVSGMAGRLTLQRTGLSWSTLAQSRRSATLGRICAYLRTIQGDELEHPEHKNVAEKFLRVLKRRNKNAVVWLSFLLTGATFSPSNQWPGGVARATTDPTIGPPETTATEAGRYKLLSLCLLLKRKGHFPGGVKRERADMSKQLPSNLWQVLRGTKGPEHNLTAVSLQQNESSLPPSHFLPSVVVLAKHELNAGRQPHSFSKHFKLLSPKAIQIGRKTKLMGETRGAAVLSPQLPGRRGLAAETNGGAGADCWGNSRQGNQMARATAHAPGRRT
eukprot:gene9481-6652_t